MADYTVFADGTIVLRLTRAEAEGLSACAGEGAEGLLNDEAAALAYIGPKSSQRAAQRGITALDSACAEAREREKRVYKLAKGAK